MKIKTKRGARRIRNQRVVDHRFVVTDYEDCSYITAGKEYCIVRYRRGTSLAFILDDSGDEITAIFNIPSKHLKNIGTWYHPIR